MKCEAVYGDEMTAAQARVAEFVDSHIKRIGWPPTRVEIALGLGLSSPNAAQCHIEALVRKGFVRIAKGTSRGISLTKLYNDYKFKKQIELENALLKGRAH